MAVISNGTYRQLCVSQSWILIRHYNISIPDNWQLITQSSDIIPGNLQLSPLKPSIQPYVQCPFSLSHSLLTHVSQLYSQLTPYVPEVHSGKKCWNFVKYGHWYQQIYSTICKVWNLSLRCTSTTYFIDFIYQMINCEMKV
jgi:hypothetical protein